MMQVDSRDRTVSPGFANGVALTLLLLLVWGAGAVLMHVRGAGVDQLLEDIIAVPTPWLLLVGLASIIVHEALHALGLRVLAGIQWTDIRFGIAWRGLAAYAHTDKSMSARSYRWSAALPGLLLGVAPLVVGLARNSSLLALYGALFTAMAGGDFAVLWVMRAIPADAVVVDSAHRAGCTVLALPPEVGG